MTVPALPADVGWTSLLTCYARAQEHQRPDRLFADPWAQQVMAAALDTDSGDLPTLGPARDDGSSQLWDMFAAYFGAGRTVFFDDHVLAGLAAGATQVVVLAAGMDGRAGRLPVPDGTRIHEVDTAPVLDYKRAVLAASGSDVGHRVPVVADLREDWVGALRSAGFDAALPTTWVVEGLLMYLDAPTSDRLLSTVRDLSAPGSRVAVEYFRRRPDVDSVPLADDDERDAIELLLGLFEPGPDAAPEEWLGRLGWRDVRVTEVPDELRRLGRPVPAALDTGLTADPLRIWLAAAQV